MAEKQDWGKLARENKPPGYKPEACPKCGSKKISSWPGGSSLKAVHGIWWSCQDCHHEWQNLTFKIFSTPMVRTTKALDN